MAHIFQDIGWLANVQRDCPIYPSGLVAPSSKKTLREFLRLSWNGTLTTDDQVTGEFFGQEYYVQDDGIISWVLIGFTYHCNSSGQPTDPYITIRLWHDTYWLIPTSPRGMYIASTVGETPWMQDTLWFPNINQPIIQDDILKWQIGLNAADAVAGGYLSVLTMMGIIKEP